MNTELKKIQDVLIQNGFKDSLYTKDIMSMNPNELEEMIAYYKPLEGKCLKNESAGRIQYTKILSVGNHNINIFGPVIRVVVDRCEVYCGNTCGGFSIEKDYILTTTAIGRFNSFTEIPEEQYNMELEILSNGCAEFAEAFNQVNEEQN